MLPFELRQLRVFLTLADELSFARTGELLGVTPSRVSQTIRELEAMIGAPLFERTSRSVSITAIGEQLRLDVLPACQQLDLAGARARDAATGIQGTLRLGSYAAPTGGPYLTEILARLEERHPGCRVEIVDVGLDALERLRRGEVDVVAHRLPVAAADLVVGPVLSREPRVLLVHERHPLAGRSSVRWDELLGETVTDQRDLPRDFMDAFIPPRTSDGRILMRRVTGSWSETIRRVLAGELVHPTVPSVGEAYLSAGVVAVPIEDLPDSDSALIWAAGSPPRTVLALADTAREIIGGRFERGPEAEKR